MRVTFNVRHLERKDLHLTGEIPPSDLELEGVDEMIHVTEPPTYDLAVERLSQSILVQGKLAFKLDCECVRCLKPFQKEIEIQDWTRDLPLSGEDCVQIENDCVDLTPFIREDILLAFPQHPLCHAECRGLLNAPHGPSPQASDADEPAEVSSAWAQLNKLKL